MSKKEKLKELYDRLIPPWSRLPLLMMLIINTGGYELFKTFTFGRTPYDWTLPLDALIPRVPATVLIYFASYPIWAFGYIVAARISREKLYRFFAADVTSKLFCFLFFIAFPTTCVRGEITESGFFAELLRFLYAVDTPLGLFPSLHCLNSWLCFMGVRGEKSIPLWYKILSCAAALAVFVSTLTTKQHVFVDTVAALIVGECFWLLSRIGALQRLTARFLEAGERYKARFFGLFKKKKENKETEER